VLAGVLLAIRLALPVVVAPLVAAHLARAIGGQVDIGDLTVQPVDAIVTLHDVTVRARAQPGAAVHPVASIVAEQVRIDVQWLPLLHRRLQVRELVLVSSRVDLDRFADGDFGVANIGRADPASELPAGWSFALDRVVLRGSQVRVRDLAAGEGAFVDVAVRRADVSGLQRRATVFGKAPNLRVVALVGGGQLAVRGRYEWRDDGIALDAQVRVSGVPLAHARSYVTALGWTDLSGHVSGQLRWQREPRRRDVLSGRLVLRHGSVAVAGLTEPAFATRRGVATIKAIDLLNRRITIDSLTVRGATLPLRLDAAAPLPLMANVTSASPSGDPRGGAAAPPRAGSAARWSWMIERFEARNSRVRILAPGGPIDLRARASGENLGRGAYWSPLRIDVAGAVVTAAFDGTARVAEGLTIEGRLTAGGIDVSSVARAAGLPWADWVQTGQATADLTVQLDTAPGDAPPFFAQGAIALTDLWVAGADPGTPSLGAAGVVLTLAELSGHPPGHAARRDGRRTRVRFSAADVNAPFVFLVRTRDGWLAPPLTSASENPSGETPEIVLEKVRGTGGSLMVVDLVPNPAVTWDVTRVDGAAESLVLPACGCTDVQVHGSHRTFGDLQFAGSRRGDTREFAFSGTGVSLAALTPYLDLARLPYRFASGSGSFTARGAVDRARWSADVALTLQAPDLVDPGASLQQALGMPVDAAFARLRDQNGDVALQVTLASPLGDGRGSYGDQVASGVRESMARAAAAARLAAAQRAATSASATIPFPPGQVEPLLSAMQQIDPLVAILHMHPDLVVALTAETSEADRRWLAEQALSATFDDGGGVVGVLRALGIRSERERIRAALAARARGAPGFLDEKDEAALTRLLAEAPPVDRAQLVAMREARLTRVLRYLADRHGVATTRIVVRHDASHEGAAQAVVRAQLMIGADAAGVPGVPSGDQTDSAGARVPAPGGGN